MGGYRHVGLLRIALAMASVAGSIAISCSAAQAGKYKVLYRFTGGGDGKGPQAAPARDADGNLYGITYEGGAGAKGTVWKLKPDGTQSVLHSFATKDGDGYHPNNGLTLDKNGNIYGTTLHGGPDEIGTIFRIKRNGAYELLHAFNGSDGALPSSRVILDSSGNIYGATDLDGGESSYGTIYKLAPDGIVTVLHRFQTIATGVYPSGDLARDIKGALYGTTGGGKFGCGTIFKLTSGGTKSILHDFICDRSGQFPNGVVRDDKTGDLFGITRQGGPDGHGIVYRRSTDGLLHTLHVFDDCCGGGLGPLGVLSVDRDYVYGVTAGGGAHNLGTVYRVRLADRADSVLHSFAGGNDGWNPAGIRLSGKYLYGTTIYGGGGGGSDSGTVFRIRK